MTFFPTGYKPIRRRRQTKPLDDVVVLELAPSPVGWRQRTRAQRSARNSGTPSDMNATTALDPRSAARRLGIGRSTLYRLLRSGDAPRSVKTGPSRADRRVFPVAALDDWLRQRSGRA